MATRLHVGTRKGLFTIERSGAGAQPWRITQTAFLSDPVTIQLFDPRDGSLYAGLNHGHFGCKLHRSTDGGASWEEIGCPSYPEKPDDEPDWVNEMSSKVIPWKLVQLWELTPGGANQPGLLWCGTIPGGLFRSEDCGKSWALVRSLWCRDERREWFGGGYDEAGLHSVVVDPRNTDRIIAGVSCGGVWVSENGGETWSAQTKGMFAEYMPPERREDPNIQDPHLVKLCPGQPDKLWVQHHNGVFRSTDGCKSWQHVPDVVPSVFGFAVAVHPTDGDTAWTVPARKDEHRIPVDGAVVVSRTRDGGKSWEVLRKGLPQEHAYDLTFRHALDIDETGERLAFGSTTGSLWISEDQGDSWSAVSNHLPPVNCVRFVKETG